MGILAKLTHWGPEVIENMDLFRLQWWLDTMIEVENGKKT